MMSSTLHAGERPRVALLGAGMMGGAIAERLLDQRFPLTVWNRTPEKTADLVARGAVPAPSPAEAAATAEIVALCLRDKGAAETVLFADGGVTERLTDRTVVLDFSTLGIAPTREFAERVAAMTGAQWVDAPVSGGPSAARSGTLTVFYGGTERAIARVAPVLGALSCRSTHMGPVGAGQATKLCNQLIVSTTMVAIAEAIAAAKAFGLDAGLLPGALAGGYADSSPLRIFGPRMASQILEPRISEISMMQKDLKALLEAAAHASIELRVARATDAIYDLAVQHGLGKEDLGALARLTCKKSH